VLAVSWAILPVVVVLTWTTSRFDPRLELGPFGWKVLPTSYLGILSLYLDTHVIPATVIGTRGIRKMPNLSRRDPAVWLTATALLSLAFLASTEALFPMLGIPFPKLGTLGLALFYACVAWASRHFGYLPLRQGSTARRILDCHPDGMALVLMDGTLGTANEGLGRLVGVPAQSLSGKRISELLEPDVTAPMLHDSEVEGELRAADGRVIPVAISTRLFQPGVASRRALVVAVRDLREVIALRSRLVTSGRLAAIGQLAAGIAHEINNPMTYVRANLALLRDHWHALAKDPVEPAARAVLADEGDELLQESLEGIERTCAIVRDIKGFAHAGHAARGPVELPRLLESVLRVAAPQLHSGIVVELDFQPVSPALGSEQELKQVFLNLVVNAAQAMGTRGRLCLRTKAAGGEVRADVEDDGCGIPPEVMERIFDPFFTTKGVGEGTGLGLFISYRVVRSHGGRIDVESTPGRGTCVSVALPADPGSE
jgi:signal transduction histidine kinase